MIQTKKKKSGVILIVLVLATLAASAELPCICDNKNNAQEEEAAGHYIEQKVEKIEYTDIAKAKAGIQ